MKNKSISIIILFTLVGSLLTIGTGYAHSPQNLEIQYDEENNILNVTITHIVADPDIISHYVQFVTIQVNDNDYLTENYTTQPTSSTFSYSYSVDAQGGDEITVTATCSLFGTISKSLTVTGEDTTPLIDISTIKGSLLGVQAEITNIADEAATNIDWQIMVTGGQFNTINTTAEGTISTLEPGNSQTIQCTPIIGYGELSIKVKAVEQGKLAVGSTAKGMVYVFFIQVDSSTSESIIPPEIIDYASDWPLANKDYASTRATTESPITSDNIESLQLEWSYEIIGIGGFGGGASNPIIMGDRVYFQDLRANIVALDIENGEVIWSKIYNDTSVEGPNGPTVGYGKIFFAKDPYTIAALDTQTGEELWSTQISFVNTTGIDIQPIVYNGIVYTSTVPGTGDIFYAAGGIGVIVALDQETGEVLWNFSTVKDRELWGNPEINSGGGCWYPPSVDTETGIIYWTTGNPAPFAGTEGWPSGSSYPVAALYTDSILALDHKTGELQWYAQAKSHDIWDHDLQISPILARQTVAGVEQNIAITAGKMGNVYTYNRDTGQLLWMLPVGIHLNDYLDPITEETKVFPGVLGGVETHMAYHDGILYVPVVNMHTNYTPTGLNVSSIDYGGATGELVAINVEFGHIIWKKEMPAMNLGGATVVNDVVFTADFNGKIYGYHTKTGELLFEHQAPAGINGWPAVKNDRIIWPCGFGGTPSVISLRLQD